MKTETLLTGMAVHQLVSKKLVGHVLDQFQMFVLLFVGMEFEEVLRLVTMEFLTIKVVIQVVQALLMDGLVVEVQQLQLIFVLQLVVI